MLKKIGKTLYYLFFGALILIALVVAVSAFPVKGNIQIKVVESGSMEPNIKTGAIVLIKPAANYSVGDVITFDGNFKDARGKRVPITHRILEVKNENGVISYITKGDANEEKDGEAVLSRSVVGKVLFSVPYAGYAVETAKKPYGFLALVIIPALLVIWSQVENIIKEVKRIKNNDLRFKNEE
ncbi:signal peptidase I [Candidatus Giovannonibacteria bacterium]|nr:signal peptidase I [Candidatus Giovannonibacteria bacterium]